MACKLKFTNIEWKLNASVKSQIYFTVRIYTMTIYLFLLKCSASVEEKCRRLAWIHCFDCENDDSKHNFSFCNPSFQKLQIQTGSFCSHTAKRKNYSFKNNQPADQETYTAFKTHTKKKSETWVVSHIVCIYLRIHICIWDGDFQNEMPQWPCLDHLFTDDTPTITVAFYYLLVWLLE